MTIEERDRLIAAGKGAADVTKRQRLCDSTVLIRLPGALHEDVCKEALRDGKSVSRVIRERLAAKCISLPVPIPKPA